MLRFRSIGYVSLVLVLLAYHQVQSATESEKASNQTVGSGLDVELERQDDKILKGHLVQKSFPIETEYGLIDFQLESIKTIDFAVGKSGTFCIVATSDGLRFRGSPRFDKSTLISKSGETWEIPAAEMRKISVIRPSKASTLSIVLGLITLAVMEIVLGIDNIIFLAIIAGKLPKEQQPKARRFGLGAALGTRLLLLFSLSWLLGLTKPIFTLPIPGLNPEASEISWRDVILLSGGLFLIWKSVKEMHHKINEARSMQQEASQSPSAAGANPGQTRVSTSSFAKVIVQIAIIDIVFSLDSVITAVGMVDEVWVMIVAMIIAMLFMLVLAGPISDFVDRHPSIKILALSFLILIGVLLVSESLGQHIDKGYVYFAMAFAVLMEIFNMAIRPRGVANMIVGEDSKMVFTVDSPPPL